MTRRVSNTSPKALGSSQRGSSANKQARKTAAKRFNKPTSRTAQLVTGGADTVKYAAGAKKAWAGPSKNKKK